ncbi:MAG: hypothetical protein ACFFBP_03830 [Promethearchaeota archaeon]
MINKTKKRKINTKRLVIFPIFTILLLLGISMMEFCMTGNIIMDEQIGSLRTGGFVSSNIKYPLNDPHDHEIYGLYYTPTAVWPDPNTDWAELPGGNVYSYGYDALATEDVIEVSDVMYFDVTPAPEHEGLPIHEIYMNLLLRARPRTPGGGYNRINIKHFNEDGSSSWEHVLDTDYEYNYNNFTITHNQLEDPNLENYINNDGLIAIEINTVNYGWWQPVCWWHVYWSPGVYVDIDLALIYILYEI